MNPVFLFSGQGSQKPGMGADLMSVSEVASSFECASDVLGYDLADLVATASPEKLNDTRYAQPALCVLSVGIARALIVEPEFIIADEPISALDMSIRAQVLNLLRHLQKERGITYLFIAHDLSVMRYISDRIAVIHKGDIVELADAEELVNHAIHPYTRSLLSAIPMPNPRLERKKKLLVYDPAMHDYSREPPQWRELRPEHFVLCSAAEAEQWLPR